MKKITQKLVWSFLILNTTLPEIVFGLDSDAKSLAANKGAIDFFEVSCSKNSDSTIGDTDHLSLKLFENDTPPPALQMLNATLIKSKLSARMGDITAGTNNSLNLKNGNGAYTLTIDTLGTNLAIKTLQSYTIQYQCLNINGLPTTGSSTLAKQGISSPIKTLANGKTTKYLINCAKNKLTGNTDSLKIVLFNNTVSQPTTSSLSNIDVSPTGTLSAQVISGIKAKNTIGSTLDLQNGNAIYKIMVNSPTNEAKSYRFEYSCLNKANLPTQTSVMKILQNQ